ncbi:hypothetical protein PJL69_00005 [Shimia sp. MMG029]|nr:hypothetical protein [Shimia sp. MMG029]MDA5555129.1 hypothetical protein [Shimia sp. MMG029]
MTTVADVLEVSRSNLHERLNGRAKPRRGYHKAQDAVVLPRIQTLVAAVVVAVLPYAQFRLVASTVLPRFLIAKRDRRPLGR